jgi:hypothetical protein
MGYDLGLKFVQVFRQQDGIELDVAPLLQRFARRGADQVETDGRHGQRPVVALPGELDPLGKRAPCPILDRRWDMWGAAAGDGHFAGKHPAKKTKSQAVTVKWANHL